MLAYQDTGGSEGGLPADHLESVDALLRECGLGTSDGERRCAPDV